MKQEKQFLLDAITFEMGKTPSFLIAQYTALEANKISDFRSQMRKVGGNFEVVKKRIFLKALKEKGLQMKLDQLPGHIGLIFASTDPIETTKAVVKFSGDNQQAVTLVGASLDGVLIDSKDVERLSKLPSKDQMRSQLLGLFEAPMAQTLSVIEALLASVPCCLDNKANKTD
jgi:large subunit ribosomal protein L10